MLTNKSCLDGGIMVDFAAKVWKNALKWTVEGYDLSMWWKRQKKKVDTFQKERCIHIQGLDQGLGLI